MSTFEPSPPWLILACIDFEKLHHERPDMIDAITNATILLCSAERDDLPTPSISSTPAGSVSIYLAAPGDRNMLICVSTQNTFVTRWTKAKPGVPTKLGRNGINRFRKMLDWLMFHAISNRPQTIEETRQELGL